MRQFVSDMAAWLSRVLFDPAQRSITADRVDTSALPDDDSLPPQTPENWRR